MSITVIIKKPTAGNFFVNDIGIIIPGAGQDSFTDDVMIRMLGASSDTRTAVRNGTLVVNDGLVDLSTAAGEKYLESLWYQSGYELADIGTWADIRYFAVDYDGGSDLNDGFSDISMVDAGTNAIKTLERLAALFPKFGNMRRAVVAIKTRAGGATYRNIANTADADLDFLDDVYGYEHLLVRGTATVASASSVAFANDTADKIACGAMIVPVTNAPGYNPAGVPTVTTFDCVLAGGGAPGLAAEPALIGKRIRFDSATTTVALRNVCRMIWQNNATTITVDRDLPAVPVATDVFYIEQPGVAVNRLFVRSSNPNNIAMPTSNAVQGIHVAGIRTVAITGTAILIRGLTAQILLAFCENPAANLLSTVATMVGDFRLLPAYSDEAAAPASIEVGVSMRMDGMSVFNSFTVQCSSFACITFRPQILGATQYVVGSASYSFAGILIQQSGSSLPSTTGVQSITVGNGGVATARRMRGLSPFAGTIISITFSNVLIRGVDLTGAGASACISVNGVGCKVSIQDAVGSTGNTGPGLLLSSSRDGSFLMGTLAANTFTGAAGQDIQGQGGEFYVHADYARTDLKDNGGNHIQGSAASIMGTATLSTNNGVANIGQYKICRATASGVVQAAQANTAANAAGIVGVSQSPFTAAGPQVAMLANGGATWVQFDAVPTAGNIAYLSTVTAGNAQDTAPAATGTNKIIALGRILRVSGTLGLVMWGAASGSQASLLAELQFGETIAVPAGGTLQLRGSGNSLVGARMNRPGTITGASIQVNVIDATRAYNLEIRVNGVAAATLALAVSTLGNSTTALAVAVVANDVITAFMVRTAGAGASTFTGDYATVEVTF